MEIKLLCALVFLGLTMADESVVRVWSGNTEFNKKLYEVLSKEEGNVFFSPLSVHTILSLVSQGSEKQTLAEFNHVLNVTYDVARNGYKSVMTSLNNVQDVKLHIANKVYLKDNYKLKSSFKDVAVQNYLAEVENVNFAETEKAATTINKWVEGKTNNKIKELISPNDLDEFTRMVLVNAVYFKGEWLHKFKKTSTSKMPFRTSATDSKEVDMMFQTDDFNYAEIDELDAQVLELPYKNKDVSMFILLPKKVDGIKELEAKMKDYDLSTVHEKMRSTEVKVFLPKFKVETTMQLNEPLKKIGLQKVFGDADLGGLLESPESLAVSKVIQKAFIEVNEEGAEAAAATVVLVRGYSIGIPKVVKVFNADHPFLYMIRAEGLKLFVGRLSKL